LSDKPKVLVLVPLEDDLLDQIRQTCEVDVLESSTPRPDLLSALHNINGVLVSPRVPADAAFFEAAPELRVLSSHSVGYDPFDISAATKHGVVVCNTPGVLTAAVANLTMALTFALTLRLRDNGHFVRSGGWARREKPPALGHDVQGKTFGVVGFGRIGQEVTRRMQALGMKTVWYDVFETPHPDAPESMYRPMEDLLRESDFVSLHTNLDDSTRHLIGAKEVALMKSSAYLINTARGGLVDQTALTEALRNDVIAGAGLDVLESEPPAEDDPVFSLPNVVCFPHIGTATEETRRLMRELAVRNLIAVLAGEKPPASVNPEVLDA
jgi:glyoxylate reductase